jgi:hypothetical protein
MGWGCSSSGALACGGSEFKPHYHQNKQGNKQKIYVLFIFGISYLICSDLGLLQESETTNEGGLWYYD